MESSSAVEALAALAHDGRLATFRLLVKEGPGGLAAGEIARRLGVPPSTLSASLAILARAGLVTAHRRGRSILYAAAFGRMADLVGYLAEDCCGGAPEVCGPLAAVVARVACCPPLSRPRAPT